MTINSIKSKAFTLAEILVTITIIGVVMVMLIKTIERIMPDTNKIMFLKTYHSMEGVVEAIINDPSRYEQTSLTDDEINQMTPEEKADLHIDMRFPPLPSAKARYSDNGTMVTVCADKTQAEKDPTVSCDGGKTLTKENALCYFTADAMHTIGPVNCENNNGITIGGQTIAGANMKLSSGVCLADMNNNISDNTLKFAIMPKCPPDNASTDKYVVYVVTQGKMTVPKTDTKYSKQSTAYGWMDSDQTQIK